MEMAEISDLMCIKYGVRKGIRFASRARHGALGAQIKISAKFARNRLKRLISHERIQGNPSFSNLA
jgi:hypothetical protein